MGMGATMKSDHIKMKAVQRQQGSFSRPTMKMTTRTLVAGLVGVVVLMSVLVPAIYGLSNHNEDSSTTNIRGM